MAIKSINCPNCNGSVQVDDSLKFGFCLYCGSKLMLQEIQKVKIEFDDTKKAANYMQLAFTAYSNANFSEAYGYFSKCLEIDVRNWKAVFYRGLCAVNLASFEKTRLNELHSGTVQALQIIGQSDATVQERVEVVTAVNTFVVRFMSSHYNLNPGFVFESMQVVNRYFASLLELLPVLSVINQAITETMMQSSPNLETLKKQILESGIRVCDLAILPVNYYNGTKTITNNGRTQTVRVTAKFKPVPLPAVQQHRNVFVNAYNSLPGIRLTFNKFSADEAQKQESIHRYEQALDAFWITHSAEKTLYYSYVSKALKIWFLVCIVVAVVSFFACVFLTPLVLLTIAALVAAIVLAIVWVVKITKSKVNRGKIEKEVFTDELKSQKKAADQAKIDLKNIIKSKEKYASSTLRK